MSPALHARVRSRHARAGQTAKHIEGSSATSIAGADGNTRAGDRYAAAADAIHEFRFSSGIIQNLAEEMTEQLNVLEEALRKIRAADTSDGLRKLADSLTRMREKRNCMEIGGFMIAMNNELQEAWRRLP